MICATSHVSILFGQPTDSFRINKEYKAKTKSKSLKIAISRSKHQNSHLQNIK